jgi:hypothetical protein
MIAMRLRENQIASAIPSRKAARELQSVNGTEEEVRLL